MRGLSLLATAIALVLAPMGPGLSILPAAAQTSAGQGTGFSMTPPLQGYSNAPASSPAQDTPRAPSVQMSAPAFTPAPEPAPPAAPATPATPAQTQTQTAPAQSVQSSAPVAAPRPAISSTGLGLPGEAGTPAPSAAPFQMVPGRVAPVITPVSPSAAAAKAAPRQPDRYIIPQRRMIFAGEVSSRSWVIYATQEEAQRQATFLLSYLNSVVVMPEASRIRVSLNGQPIIERAIAASQEPANVETPIQRGVLRPGANLIRIDVVQRHRTDCAVSATYELWTEINNENTGISFTGGRPPLSGGLDDLAAVGVDQYGITPIRIVTPGPIEGGGSTRVLRAVQGLAVRGQYPNPAITMGESTSGPTPKGGLTVVIGTASELPRLMAEVPDDARQRPITLLMEDDRLGAPTLVISGPTPSDVDRAIDRLNAASIVLPEAINTLTRFAPSAPLFTGARSVRLAELGVGTQEFSGRRFRMEFQIALPPDFYAQAYGNARLLLDAAYTAAVRPGSHIDVYVNEQIASNLPITRSGGGLMQREAMQIPLRNFRPGVNRLWLEVVLDTESDARCLPGATLPAEDRFVLFDSTEFTMENFARIGRLPNLAAFASDAFPYDLDKNPLAVVLARQDASTLAAAGTLMARLALANGEPLPIDAAAASVTLGERNAIFVGGIDHISPSVMSQVRIAETTRSNWVVSPDESQTSQPVNASEYDNVLERFRSRQAGNAASVPPVDSSLNMNTPEVYQRWRDNVRGSDNIYGLIEAFEGWLTRTFSINFESFRLQEGKRALYEPPARTSVLMAQGNSPSGTAVWTLVAGRTPESLAASITRFTSEGVWNRIGGQAVAYQLGSGELDQRHVISYRFISTQPFSLNNLRLIAANWLSINILPYALMLMIAAMLLGIATSFLLHRLGRPS